jgi:hypothetical protein
LYDVHLKSVCDDYSTKGYWWILQYARPICEFELLVLKNIVK